jgi:hypothetical protein
MEMKKWASNVKRTLKERRGRRKNINLAIVSANNHSNVEQQHHNSRCMSQRMVSTSITFLFNDHHDPTII